MMEKTPGVYVTEPDAFPNSVVQAPTGLPAFIGYTEKSENETGSFLNVPVRINDFAEFERLFGGPPIPVYAIEQVGASRDKSPGSGHGSSMPPDLPQPEISLRDPNTEVDCRVVRTSAPFAFHAAIRMFFRNGGNSCYITSIGQYDDQITAAPMKAAIDELKSEPEPDLLVIPEAMCLPHKDAMAVQNHMLKHCGEEMQNRFAILDVPGGYLPLKGPHGNPVDRFRAAVDRQTPSFGAAYYPWVRATLNTPDDFSFRNFTTDCQARLKRVLGRSVQDEPKLEPILDKLTAKQPLADKDAQQLDQILRSAIPIYASLMQSLADAQNVMPPASAMAGIYAMVDATVGSWKAPANVSMNAVSAPSVALSNEEQEDLNVPLSGLSICAIRAFAGRGVLVWGARTLDGNSQDWRYVPVRRVAIMIEQSIKTALEALVFAPNDASTWSMVKAMTENFLTNVWKSGALAGAKPSDAFQVRIGLGDTMTGNDVLSGTLKMTVLIAVSHPAEFIVLQFQQSMQQS